MYGLENFGNTCYCNSVLQALYFCTPLREKLLEYHSTVMAAGVAGGGEENLLTCLAELFAHIAAQKKKTGVVAPKRFVQRLKKDNELFRSFMHQDAHEFLNFLLNEVCDILQREERARTGERSGPPPDTWVHDIFQGKLTNQTRCLWCETVTSREEAFLDLSLDIEQNSSVSSCLKNFSSVETLGGADKFHCDACCGLQEAQRRMLVKSAPPVLALHLKRFKFIEQLGRYKKLTHRVVFPNELKLGNMVEGAPGQDTAYHLFAVVVHIGTGPNHGHYVSVVKSHNRWLFFDDEHVDIVEDESLLQSFFGSTQETGAQAEHGYILFYAREEV